MLCQNCKKRLATVNHVEVVNGKACALHLCDFCANQMFGEFENQFANAVLSGLFGEEMREEKVCPACGMTFSEYQRGGLLGCPSCYDVFKEELMPYIARIQGKTVHVGKGGGVHTAEQDLRLKLAALQESMENALTCGDFAEAEAINRRMQVIKKKLGGVR